jgi:hypothetical protein
MTKQEFMKPFSDLEAFFHKSQSLKQREQWFEEFKGQASCDFGDGCYACRRFLTRFPTMQKLWENVDKARARRKTIERQKNTVDIGVFQDVEPPSPVVEKYMKNINRIISGEITPEQGMANFKHLRRKHGDGKDVSTESIRNSRQLSREKLKESA